MCVCVRACVCACVRVCMRSCDERAFVCLYVCLPLATTAKLNVMFLLQELVGAALLALENSVPVIRIAMIDLCKNSIQRSVNKMIFSSRPKRSLSSHIM